MFRTQLWQGAGLGAGDDEALFAAQAEIAPGVALIASRLLSQQPGLAQNGKPAPQFRGFLPGQGGSVAMVEMELDDSFPGMVHDRISRFS